MGEYKMSDVFVCQIEGRLTVGSIRKELYQDIDHNMIDIVAKFRTVDHARYAAHAIKSHDNLVKQVEELKEALILMSDDSYHSQLWFDCGYHKQIDELLTRIGDKDE